jgi:hypothetical protein
MELMPVTDPSFAAYGRVVSCLDGLLDPIVATLGDKTPCPEATDYVASDPAIEALPEAKRLGVALYGGQAVQFGWCNGHNTRLNCLEYHRDSEFNLGTVDFVLLLAKLDQVRDGRLDTADVRAFKVPAGVLVEVFATTLHYAPCHTDAAKGFKVLVALPAGTNGPRPAGVVPAGDAGLLWAANKWLLAHADSAEAAQGAAVALEGDNIDIKDLI